MRQPGQSCVITTLPTFYLTEMYSLTANTTTGATCGRWASRPSRLPSATHPSPTSTQCAHFISYRGPRRLHSAIQQYGKSCEIIVRLPVLTVIAAGARSWWHSSTNAWLRTTRPGPLLLPCSAFAIFFNEEATFHHVQQQHPWFKAYSERDVRASLLELVTRYPGATPIHGSHSSMEKLCATVADLPAEDDDDAPKQRASPQHGQEPRPTTIKKTQKRNPKVEGLVTGNQAVPGAYRCHYMSTRP